MYDAYTRIFARCGLKTHPVEDTGAIGGDQSHEFMVPDAREFGCVLPSCGWRQWNAECAPLNQQYPVRRCAPWKKYPHRVTTVEELIGFAG